MGILQKTLSVIVRKAMLTMAIAAGKKILGKAVAPTDHTNAESNTLDTSDKPSDFLSTGMPTEIAKAPKKAASSQTRSRGPRKNSKTSPDQADQEAQNIPPAKKPARSRKPAQSSTVPPKDSTAEIAKNTTQTTPKKPRAPRKKTPPAET